ncbi:MATE family efflux transporter [Ligilactobacillus sp.]|uniref:MATE family efflux transporter n=1 Tax=Ligilactobacillus sp. TaxID=2767921 RepID=UPI002FE3008D
MENKMKLFESAPVWKAYFIISLPVVLSMVVTLVYNMVDTFFVAGTQNTSLVAGVSQCTPLFTLMLALGDIFGLGGSSVISRLFGQKDDGTARNVSGFCFYAAIACGLVVTVLMFSFQGPILHVLGATSDTIEYASQYYFWIALGAPVIILSLTPSNIIRTEGLATQSMIASISGSVLNIILDPLFIFTLGMGAGGAALATVLGYVLSDAMLVYYILKKSRHLTVSVRHVKIQSRLAVSVFVIGIPASLTNLMQSYNVTVLNRHLISYGAKAVAAMGIAMKVNMIIMMIMVGFAFGAQPLIGYAYGAGNRKRLKDIIRFDLLVEIAFSVVVAAFVIGLAPQLIGLFMKDASVVSYGTGMLRWLTLTTPFCGIVLVLTTCFISMGKAVPSFVLSISRQGVIFTVVILISSACFGYNGVISAQAVSDVLTALAGVLMYVSMSRKDAGSREN